MTPPITTGPRGFWGAAPTRFFVMFVVMVLAYAGGQLAVLSLGGWAPAGPIAGLAVGAAVASGAAMVGLYVLLVRVLERRRSDELAVPPGGGLLAGGVLVGIALFCAVFGVLTALGVARLAGINGVGGAIQPLALAILAGIGEELAFRGVVFRVVEESCGTLVALAASAGFFGLAHLSAPGATALSTAAIALEAGVLLAAAYAMTRSLWFPIGLHIGWNFTEGGVFGTAVSGHAAHGLMNAVVAGPAAVTGGAFGPEASPAAVGVCLVAAAGFLIVAVRRGRWERVRFRLYPR